MKDPLHSLFSPRRGGIDCSTATTDIPLNLPLILLRRPCRQPTVHTSRGMVLTALQTNTDEDDM